MASNRVIVICLDAFDVELCERYISEGRLSGLKALKDASAFFPLQHGEGGLDRYTGLTWEHFSSGLYPNSAEKWSSTWFDPDNYEAGQSHASVRPFLADLDVNCVVFDAPYFDLRQMTNATGVVGWAGHDTGVEHYSQPQGLSGELSARFGTPPSPSELNSMVYPSVEKTEKMGDTLVETIRTRSKAAQWLLEERAPDWDVAVIGVSETHDGVELFCHGELEHHQIHNSESAEVAKDKLIEVYEAVSDLIENMTSAFPDATIVAFTMHGMGWNDTDIPTMALLPELMYRINFGEPFLKNRDDWLEVDVPQLKPDENWTRVIVDQMPVAYAPPRPGLAERAVRKALRLVSGGDKPAKEPAAEKDPYNFPVDWMPAAKYKAHWPKMTAFAAPSYFDGRIRVNLVGRERDGIVPLSDYTRTLDEIEKYLLECVDTNTGEPLIRQIDRPGIADPYKLSDTQADLCILWNGSPVGVHHPKLGQIGPFPIRRVGGHSGGLGGMFVQGEGIDPGPREERSSFDVAPTVVDLLGQVRPNRLDGQSVFEKISE